LAILQTIPHLLLKFSEVKGIRETAPQRFPRLASDPGCEPLLLKDVQRFFTPEELREGEGIHILIFAGGSCRSDQNAISAFRGDRDTPPFGYQGDDLRKMRLRYDDCDAVED
jgi:hypothetical protein